LISLRIRTQKEIQKSPCTPKARGFFPFLYEFAENEIF